LGKFATPTGIEAAANLAVTSENQSGIPEVPSEPMSESARDSWPLAETSRASVTPKPEPIADDALVEAMTKATLAGRYELAEGFARQLDDRRRARAPNVIPFKKPERPGNS